MFLYIWFLLERKKAEYDMFKQQLDRLEEDLQYVFEGTKEELLKQIESHDEELIGQTDKIEEVLLISIIKQKRCAQC